MAFWDWRHCAGAFHPRPLSVRTSSAASVPVLGARCCRSHLNARPLSHTLNSIRARDCFLLVHLLGLACKSRSTKCGRLAAGVQLWYSLCYTRRSIVGHVRSGRAGAAASACGAGLAGALNQTWEADAPVLTLPRQLTADPPPPDMCIAAWAIQKTVRPSTPKVVTRQCGRASLTRLLWWSIR